MFVYLGYVSIVSSHISIRNRDTRNYVFILGARSFFVSWSVGHTKNVIKVENV